MNENEMNYNKQMENNEQEQKNEINYGQNTGNIEGNYNAMEYRNPMQGNNMNYNGQMQGNNMNYSNGMQNGGTGYGNQIPNNNMSYNNGNQMQGNSMNYNGQMQSNNMNYNNGMQNMDYGNQMQGNNMNYNGQMQGNNMNYNNGNQYNNQMQGNNMNYNTGFGNNGMDYGVQPTENPQVNNFDMNEITEYKKILRQDREVQNLTSEVNVENPNSIIMFGQGASENISKVSDQLLNSMKSVKAEEASEMLTNLTKLMDKFDVKELDGSQKQNMFSKLLRGVGDTVAKLFQKYDTMGMEVEKIYVLLKRYENDIKESNANLKKLYDANLHYYKLLEKYIVAGEMAVEEVDAYISQIENNPTINDEQRQMMIQKLQIAKDMLSQRVYDLQIAENVAIQAAPMIQTIQMSNFNLMRKINSSFIVTLPIFKQCLAQAIILKRQEIQAKSIKQLDEKTNELIMRNATNTARQSVEIAKMSSGSSIAISTLEKSYETIMKGIEDTKAIQEANRQERVENSKRLEVIKHEMKKNIPN